MSDLARRWFFPVAMMLVLAACATPHGGRAPVGASVDRYALEARFGLRDGSTSYSGRLSWRHDPVSDAVLVQDPFGGGVAELSAGPGRSRMRLADGRVVEAADARDLMHNLTGIALPVRDLARWLTARETTPAVDAAASPADERDALGRVVRMKREGWQLDYRYDDDEHSALPSRVIAANGEGIELRLAIESWGQAPTR